MPIFTPSHDILNVYTQTTLGLQSSYQADQHTTAVKYLTKNKKIPTDVSSIILDYLLDLILRDCVLRNNHATVYRDCLLDIQFFGKDNECATCIQERYRPFISDTFPYNYAPVDYDRICTCSIKRYTNRIYYKFLR